MADAISTIKGRKKMLLARAGQGTLPKIKGFAFGNGGVDSSGNVKTPTETQTALNNELLRKDADSVTILTDTSARYSVTLNETELAGINISEIALYDNDGDLVAIKNFTPKGKDSDVSMTFAIDDIL